MFALKGRFWAHVEGGEIEHLPNVRIGVSGYRGVSRRSDGRWRVRLHVDGKEIALGGFDTPEEAAHAYDRAACELLGDRARLNFPEEDAA